MKVTVCGSYAFQADMEQIVRELGQAGHEVKYPSLLLEERPTGKNPLSIQSYIEEKGGIEAFPPGHEIWEKKANAIDNHFEKIAWSGAVLIVNLTKHDMQGYIGGNTLMEMAVARSLSKKIFLMNRPSSKLPYVEEILGMKPIILDEDISKIV